MSQLLKEIRYNGLPWLLAIVPLALVAAKLKPLLPRFGVGERTADLLTQVEPITGIAATTAAVRGFGLPAQLGVAVSSIKPALAWGALEAQRPQQTTTG